MNTHDRDRRRATAVVAPGLERVLDPARVDGASVGPGGIVDLLGEQTPPVSTLAQRLMRTRLYAEIYQLGRPLGRRLVGGFRAPGRDGDRRQIGELLNLRPGGVVVDIGCGPGNFTGWFSGQVAPRGLAVGVDASAEMLARAAADNGTGPVVYVRGDAEDLPFVASSADAVACLAALYLVNNPDLVIDEMVRILKPGGHLVILTSLAPRVGRAVPLAEKLSGVTWFSRDYVTDRLAAHGLIGIRQFTDGLAQTVTATKAKDEPGGDRR